ncbi:MAG: invasion associated locus B family protein, partial [Maritimibacter sp.]|nr:invasion associated locus B family protein [Maritimibacter sp.]
CLVQPNLSAADIEAFKAGTVLNMGFAIVAKPTELATINSPISLKGFTAAWDSVKVPEAPAAQ